MAHNMFGKKKKKESDVSIKDATTRLVAFLETKKVTDLEFLAGAKNSAENFNDFMDLINDYVMYKTCKAQGIDPIEFMSGFLTAKLALSEAGVEQILED